MVSLFISSLSVLGAIQSFAGFTDYFTTMAQEGWFPLLCVGLRSQWENVQLQDLQDSYGQEWVCKLTNYSRECLYSHLHRNQVTPPLMSPPVLADVQSEVVPGVYVLHCVFRQYRDLPDLRCADQENSTSLCVPARLLQVSEDSSLT